MVYHVCIVSNNFNIKMWLVSRVIDLTGNPVGFFQLTFLTTIFNQIERYIKINIFINLRQVKHETLITRPRE